MSPYILLIHGVHDGAFERGAAPSNPGRSRRQAPLERHRSASLTPSQPSVRRRRWPLLLVLAAILVGGYSGWHYVMTTRATDAAVDLKTAGGKGGAPAPIPVTVAPVKKADFSVYLNGLGTVQPFHTVTVRSRVDGQIIKVAVQAGPDGEGGRYPRRNRSASLSGGARPGAGQEGAGRGQPEERAAQPRALRSVWPRRISPPNSRSTRSRRWSIS